MFKLTWMLSLLHSLWQWYEIYIHEHYLVEKCRNMLFLLTITHPFFQIFDCSWWYLRIPAKYSFTYLILDAPPVYLQISFVYNVSLFLFLPLTNYMHLQGREAGCECRIFPCASWLPEAHWLLSHKPLRWWSPRKSEAKEPEGSCKEGLWWWRRWGWWGVKCRFT